MSAPDKDPDLDTWNEWKKEYNKKYKTKEEEEYRFGIFKKTLLELEKDRAQGCDEVGLNKFSDFLLSEMPGGRNTEYRDKLERQRAKERIEAGIKDRHWDAWCEWKKKYNKRYKRQCVEDSRFAIFKKSILELKKERAKIKNGRDYEVGLTQFADFRESEMPSGRNTRYRHKQEKLRAKLKREAGIPEPDPHSDEEDDRILLECDKIAQRFTWSAQTRPQTSSTSRIHPDQHHAPMTNRSQKTPSLKAVERKPMATNKPRRHQPKISKSSRGKLKRT